ncbi:hypothetical protein RND71_024131 [Anisodus tanguticus]|uniref:Uncharacterized protein n=1 Tax=Anisodus tanguticus TaxID=243964 RepID=A0AAE1RMP1_9SOLA|nr:hypothetical protein RND71_024131 [Anisodus tanguticus]
MEPPVVVYIRGSGDWGYLWYRMEFENNTIRDSDGEGKVERNRINLKPIAKLRINEGGLGGGWAVIGEEQDDIYWVGGFYEEEGGRIYTCLDEDSPFIAAIGKKKLCVVSGYEEFLPKPKDDDARSPKHRWNSYDWSKAGEIYDPDTNSWTYVDAPMEHFREYRSLGAALAVDKDEILFPCRADRSIVEEYWVRWYHARMIEAADKRLNGNFKEEEMKKLLLVELGCANPDSNERPCMRRVFRCSTTRRTLYLFRK